MKKNIVIVLLVISLISGMFVGSLINADRKEKRFDQGYSQHIRNAAAATTQKEAYNEAKAAVDFLEAYNIQDVIIHHPEFTDFYNNSTAFRDKVLDWSNYVFAYNGTTHEGVNNLLQKYELVNYSIVGDGYRANAQFPEKLQYQLYS